MRLIDMIYLTAVGSALLAMAPACSRVTVATRGEAPDPAPPAPSAPTLPPLAPETRPAPDRPLRGRGEIALRDRPQASRVEVEVARTEAERRQGLMFRRHLADDHGMLFLMPYDNEWVFYMRNTYLPLDMVFIDREWRVVGVVENAAPLTEDHRSVAGESRYVLELTAHTAGKLGMRPGTHLAFVPLPDRPAPGP